MIRARIILTGTGKKQGTGKKSERAVPNGKPSALLDARVIYCGDCLEQLRNLPDACVYTSQVVVRNNLIFLLTPARPGG